ncbi:hypothetical protein P9112_001775 [Eukaryota sp. TZLM1-RC]
MLYHFESCEIDYLSNHIVLYRYPNGIAALTLSPDHPILSRNISDIHIHKVVSVKGKRKDGSITVFPDTKLATINTSSGEVFELRYGVKGKLISVNEQLNNNTSLLNHPLTTFIAILSDVST